LHGIDKHTTLKEVKQIVVRMPNWLGDMIMATAFIKALWEEYPGATIDLIVKKELVSIANLIPGIGALYSYSKKESNSRQFGKQLAKQKKYDLFFCLPNSFSSASMAFATGAKKRIGYKKEFRSFLLTNSFRKPAGLHRVEEYVELLALFTKKRVTNLQVQLQSSQLARRNAVVVNINSEADSRRLPVEKAVQIINLLCKEITAEIILVGSPKEAVHVNTVYQKLADTTHITNTAGTTSLPEMVELFSAVKAVLTTDSGPAHIANAMSTPVVILFGAGNEDNTAPYNKTNREIIRLGKLSCEKCVSNKCKQYGIPKCLLDLDNAIIISAIKKYL
jgi:heptosyltransferase II